MHNTAQLAGSTCYHTRGDLSVACNEVAVCMIGFKYDIDRCRESSGVCEKLYIHTVSGTLPHCEFCIQCHSYNMPTTVSMCVCTPVDNLKALCK